MGNVSLSLPVSILLLEAANRGDRNQTEPEGYKTLKTPPPVFIMQPAHCLFRLLLKKFAVQKLSILIIQFNTKLSRGGIVSFWKYFPVQSEEYSKVSYMKCHILGEVDWEAWIHDIVSCFKESFNLQTGGEELNLPRCAGRFIWHLFRRRIRLYLRIKDFVFLGGFLKAARRIDRFQDNPIVPVNL